MTEKEKLELKLKKLESENDVKYRAYLDKRNAIIEKIHMIGVEKAKAIVGETYYGELVHVTSKCSNGRVNHFIGVIDADTVDENSFGFKGGVTHILTENGKFCGVDYNDNCGGWQRVAANTKELFVSGKTSYRDINPKFYHDVEIRRTTKEDEEEFVNSAYNENILSYSNKQRSENEKSISAMIGIR